MINSSFLYLSTSLVPLLPTYIRSTYSSPKVLLPFNVVKHRYISFTAIEISNGCVLANNCPFTAFTTSSNFADKIVSIWASFCCACTAFIRLSVNIVNPVNQSLTIKHIPILGASANGSNSESARGSSEALFAMRWTSWEAISVANLG